MQKQQQRIDCTIHYAPCSENTRTVLYLSCVARRVISISVFKYSAAAARTLLPDDVVEELFALDAAVVVLVHLLERLLHQRLLHVREQLGVHESHELELREAPVAVAVRRLPSRLLAAQLLLVGILCAIRKKRKTLARLHRRTETYEYRNSTVQLNRKSQ